MARKIIWAQKAQDDRYAIFNYWNNRIKSNSYSTKLNKLFIEAIEIVSLHPLIGKYTIRKNIRIKTVSHFALIYEHSDEEIIVLSIFDTRQDPNILKQTLDY